MQTTGQRLRLLALALQHTTVTISHQPTTMEKSLSLQSCALLHDGAADAVEHVFVAIAKEERQLRGAKAGRIGLGPGRLGRLAGDVQHGPE